ncbi:hypothetical protein NMG60_11023168 [Bertholletia excelsa]
MFFFFTISFRRDFLVFRNLDVDCTTFGATSWSVSALLQPLNHIELPQESLAMTKLLEWRFFYIWCCL